MADPEHDAPADPQAASPRSSHPPSGPPDSGRSLSARLSIGTATATATTATANAFETGSTVAEEDTEWTNAANAHRSDANVHRSTPVASARSSHLTEVELTSEPKTQEQPEEPELTALRLELVRARRALFEESADGPPSISAVREDSDGVDVNTEFRVVEFADGVYRGEVSPREPTDSCDWVPHGFGVLTTARGDVCCGQWSDGTQVGYGTICNATLHYAGECCAMPNTTRFTANTIYGVGLYTFGALFVGSWHDDPASYPAHDVDRCTPHGLGKLTLRSDPSGRDTSRVESGWFQGLRRPFSDTITTDSNAFLLSTTRHYAHLTQPERGLVIADAKLVFWRRNALTRGLGRWRRWSCDLSVQQAIRSRLLALKAQHKAREAERRAITTQIAALVTQRRHTNVEVITKVEAARITRERGLERRKLHTQRLAEALEHRDLTRVCVSAQQEAVTLLQQELTQILQLLNEAKQAQENCAKSAQKLQILKRQIQKVTMSLSAVTKPAHASNPLQFSRPPTPSRTTTPQHNSDDLPYELVQTPHPPQQFVCDVPGCVCGIPRDVFLRVAAALNGE